MQKKYCVDKVDKRIIKMAKKKEKKISWKKKLDYWL